MTFYAFEKLCAGFWISSSRALPTPYLVLEKISKHINQSLQMYLILVSCCLLAIKIANVVKAKSYLDIWISMTLHKQSRRVSTDNYC